jgi:hypothetical protein
LGAERTVLSAPSGLAIDNRTEMDLFAEVMLPQHLRAFQKILKKVFGGPQNRKIRFFVRHPALNHSLSEMCKRCQVLHHNPLSTLLPAQMQWISFVFPWMLITIE